MDEKELDLSKVNEIDMECEVDDDDDGFGGFVKAEPKDHAKKEVISFADEMPQPKEGPSPVGAANDGRELSTKTGIILDFGDSEVSFKPDDIEVIDSPTISAEMTDEGIEFKAPVHEEDYFNGNFKGYNQIDMECSVGEDDDFGGPVESNRNKRFDFGDDDEEFTNELVNEEIVKESKKRADDQISQGKVEDDYYDKLKKKDLATNVKGAYNTHFHFAGNPKLEMDDFNHDNTPTGPIPNAVTAPSVGAGDSNMTVAAQGMGMAEGYRKLFEDLLLITGFELGDCKDGKCTFKDRYSNTDDRICTTIDEVEEFLTPYVEDCFIIPLQVETGKDFKTCKEWSDWYTPEVQKANPYLAKDIQYCDLCANHLPDCKLF